MEHESWLDAFRCLPMRLFRHGKDGNVRRGGQGWVTLPFQTGTTEARRRCGECSELLELKNGDAMRRHRQFQFLAGKVGLRVSEQWGDSTC
jgi:hypothetical protein